MKDLMKKLIVFGMIMCLVLGTFPNVQAMAGNTKVVTFKGKADTGKKYTVKVTFDKKTGKAKKVQFISGKKTKTFSDISTPGNDPSVYWSGDMSFCMCIWYKGNTWTVKHINKIVVTHDKYSGEYKKVK